jgi:hypothetical protein
VLDFPSQDGKQTKTAESLVSTLAASEVSWLAPFLVGCIFLYFSVFLEITFFHRYVLDCSNTILRLAFPGRFHESR